MPAPKIPPRFSPRLAELYQSLYAIADSERMTALVDYIEDLRKEFDAVSAELKELGFCTPCYLTELDDGDDHDCVGEV